MLVTRFGAGQEGAGESSALLAQCDSTTSTQQEHAIHIRSITKTQRKNCIVKAVPASVLSRSNPTLTNPVSSTS